MTSFTTDGFLSTEIADFEGDICKNYSYKLTLAREVNQVGHKIMYSAEIGNQSLPDLLLATLLTRQLSSFQAFIILLQKGLKAQAEILLRNIAESMFIIGAVDKDASFADEYVLSEEVSRKKSLEALVRNSDREGKTVDKETIDLIENLKTRIKNEGIKSFPTEQIAQRANLQNYYDTLYRLTSMSVHTSARGLDAALQTDDSDLVESIMYEPITERLDLHIDYGISMMLYSLHIIASHYKLDINEIESLQKRNRDLAGTA